MEGRLRGHFEVFNVRPESSWEEVGYSQHTARTALSYKIIHICFSDINQC